MNLPNQITLFRVLAIPFFVVMLYVARNLGEAGNLSAAGWIYVGSFVLTVVVAVTDWLDGHLARKWALVTNFGKLADPLADKVFVAAALIVLADFQLIPAWAVIIIIAREFIVTGIRQLAQDAGSVMAADRLGKHKTGWQLGLILTCLAVLGVKYLTMAAGIWEDPLSTAYAAPRIAEILIFIPLMVTLFLTILSGWNYLWGQRSLFRGQL